MAVVDPGGRIHGRDPDSIDAEILQVVEPRGDAIDVTDATLLLLIVATSA